MVDEQEEARQQDSLAAESNKKVVLRRGFSKRLVWWLIECVIRESSNVYEFRADETTFYFVAFCVAFAMCMALSHSDRHRHIGRRLCVAVSTALVSCGIVSLVLAGFSSAGFTLTSPWPGLGMAAILGSLKEKVYTVGWDMLQWFWKGKINFTFVQKQDNDK